MNDMNAIVTFAGGFSMVSQLFKVALPVLLLMAVPTQADMHPQEGCFEDDLVCQVFKITAAYETPDSTVLRHVDSYECLHGSVSYDLELPQDFLNSHPFLDSGNTRISIPGGCINGTKVTYPSSTTITVLPEPSRRRLDQYSSHGNKTVLVVRVNEKGRSYNPADYKLRDYVFRDTPGSLVNQMNDCSQGKTRLQMAQGPGIVNGVYNLRLDFEVDGMLNRDIERNHIPPKMVAIGGESAYDYVIYCYPPGIVDKSGKTNWGAYAILNTPRSVYSTRNCGALTYMMHELGHNFGLHHANQYGWEYADITGNMGGGSNWKYGPKSCYNAHKNWQLGWYQEWSLDLTDSIRSNPWGGRMLAFVDAKNALETDVTIIKIGEFYVQFNRRRNFNDGTREFGDRVTIVSQLPTKRVRDVPRSNLEAGIAKGVDGAPTTFTSRNYDGTSHSLVFEVCDQVYGPPDYVHLSIHLDNGIQTSQCTVPLPADTPSPTIAPTISVMPSSSPSSPPSAVPTISLEPSAAPSEPPTGMPSSSPTDRMTPTPSTSPSVAPTMDCTGMDSPGLVPVNRGHGSKTCEWIAQHKGWKRYLCREGFDAFEQCQETCKSCNDQADETPSTSDTCEDSPKMFFVNDALGSRRCWQLQRFFERSPQWKDKLCFPENPAYDHCPETCGKCTDTCEDQADKVFYVNRRQGHQDCAWLAKRPMWQSILCHEGHDAYKYCNELCNTCP